MRVVRANLPSSTLKKTHAFSFGSHCWIPDPHSGKDTSTLLRTVGCNSQKRLYPFLRIRFKPNVVCSLQEERLIFGLSHLSHSNRSPVDSLPSSPKTRKLSKQPDLTIFCERSA